MASLGVALQRLLAGGSARGRAALGFRGVSTGRRDFWQNINEQHLAHELEGIAACGRDGASVATGIFDPKVRLRPTRRPTPAPAAVATRGGRAGPSAAGSAGAEVPSGESGVGDFLPGRRRAKPWLHYESLRGDTYPSGEEKGPRWQDLTHGEAQRLQEMYMRKKMLDRKILWMKMQDQPNPEKEAKLTLRRQKRREEEEKAAGSGLELYPPPFMDAHPGSNFLQRMEDTARRDELESRFRSRIREQKLENARIIKANTPSVGDIITDPIQRHVERRLVRQREKIHAGLEEILTRNTAQILFEFLRGVAISIVRVRAKKPRQTQEIVYSLTSDHDPAWVQRQLDILAPKLRSQLALRVNMGQTPNIRFVPQVASQEVRRAHLWPSAQQLQDEIPVGGGFGSNVGVG